MSAANNYRLRERALAMVDRGHLCDLCGTAKATDYHEIVSRGRTLNNEEARRLSYNRLICSILCKDCHAKAAQPKISTALLARNAIRYGWMKVCAAYYAVNEAMTRPTDIDLPSGLERTNMINPEVRDFAVLEIITILQDRGGYVEDLSEIQDELKMDVETFNAALDMAIRAGIITFREWNARDTDD